MLSRSMEARKRRESLERESSRGSEESCFWACYITAILCTCAIPRRLLKQGGRDGNPLGDFLVLFGSAMLALFVCFFLVIVFFFVLLCTQCRRQQKKTESADFPNHRLSYFLQFQISSVSRNDRIGLWPGMVAVSRTCQHGSNRVNSVATRRGGSVALCC